MIPFSSFEPHAPPLQLIREKTCLILRILSNLINMYCHFIKENQLKKLFQWKLKSSPLVTTNLDCFVKMNVITFRAFIKRFKWKTSHFTLEKLSKKQTFRL